jgi:hypothetical protein
LPDKNVSVIWINQGGWKLGGSSIAQKAYLKTRFETSRKQKNLALTNLKTIQ